MSNDRENENPGLGDPVDPAHRTAGSHSDARVLLLPEELPTDHRSGFVAVVGKPNVGKSTLMNAYLGQKIAIVSSKPQTTRNRLLGILTLIRDQGDMADAQLIFVDTPGVHQPLHKLGEYMLDTAVRAIPDADLVLFMVDVSQPPGAEDRQIAEIIRQSVESRAPSHPPVLLVLNKGDRLPPDRVTAHVAAYRSLGEEQRGYDDWLLVSALRGDNLDRLLGVIIELLPPGPRYFPEEQVTDQQLRFIAAELVREQVLRQLHQEVPHAVAVVVEDFAQRSENLTYISANVFVERKTQKGILLGHRGSMIARIGRAARREIEELLGTRVYLELWVKVKRKWRKDEQELRRLGYQLPRRDT